MHLHTHPVAIGLCGGEHCATLGRILYGIFIEIPHHLDQELGIAFGSRETGRNLNGKAVIRRRGGHLGGGAPRDRIDQHRFGQGDEPPSHDGSHAEHIRQHLIELGAFGDDVLQQLGTGFGIDGVAGIGQQPGPAVDRGQRRAELMRDQRKEVVLELLGFPQASDVLKDDDRLHDRALGVA